MISRGTSLPSSLARIWLLIILRSVAAADDDDDEDEDGAAIILAADVAGDVCASAAISLAAIIPFIPLSLSLLGLECHRSQTKVGEWRDPHTNNHQT